MLGLGGAGGLSRDGARAAADGGCRHPELGDAELVGLSRKVTFVLALAGLAVAVTVSLVSETRTVFWFVIFGWSGIAATFCPAMILSLFWSKLSRAGVIGGMAAGFLSVPLFKFLPAKGSVLAALTELPPSFFCSFVVAVVLSLLYPVSAEEEKLFNQELQFSGEDEMLSGEGNE